MPWNLTDHEDLWRDKTSILVDCLETLQVPGERSAAIQSLADVLKSGHVLGYQLQLGRRIAAQLTELGPEAREAEAMSPYQLGPP